MKRYALTGGIATGKSTATQYLIQQGLAVIDCDALVHSEYGKGQRIYKAILDRFGEDILTDQGEIDRKALGQLVFNDVMMREALNRATHPIVEDLLNERLSQFESMGVPFVIVDHPLLFEVGANIYYDGILLIDLEEQEQVRRLMGRNGWTEVEARLRIDAQMPLTYKRSHSDWVIENSGTVEELYQMLKQWVKVLESI